MNTGIESGYPQAMAAMTNVKSQISNGKYFSFPISRFTDSTGMKALKMDLERQLTDAGIQRAGDSPESGSKTGLIVARRIIEIRVIQHVEVLRAEFQIYSFSKTDMAHQADVPGRESGTSGYTLAGGSIRPDSIVCERRRIQIIHTPGR